MMRITGGRTQKRAAVVASLLALGGGISACGSSSNKASATGASTNGSPLTIMLAVPGESDFYGLGNLKDGANAAVEAIDASGGVKGHPIKLVTCDTGQPIGNPQGSANCGQSAVSSHILAAVGLMSTYAGPMFTYLAKQSIPAITPLDSSADNIQNTSPLSWVIEPASITVPVTDIMAMGQAGCKKIAEAFQSTNNTADSQAAAFANAAAKYAGAELVRISVPPTQTDFAPIVAQAESAGADCFDQELPSTTLNPILTAIKDSGKQLRVGSTIAIDSPSVLTPLGAAANGIIVSDPFYPEGSGHTSEATADFAKYAPSAPTNIIQLGNWESVEIFAQAAKKAMTDGKPLTSASIQQELGTLSNVDLGLAPPMDFTKPGPFPGESRVFSTISYAYTYSDGKFTSVSSQEIDPAAAVSKFAPNA